MIWKVRPRPRWARAHDDIRSMRSPASWISPPSAWMVLSIRLNNVVLPDPFGPIRPVIEPSWTTSEAPSTALSPPNDLRRSLTSSRGVGSGALSRSTRESRAVSEARLPPVPMRAPTGPALPRVRTQFSSDSIAGSTPCGRNSTITTSRPPNSRSRVFPPPRLLLAYSLRARR